MRSHVLESGTAGREERQLRAIVMPRDALVPSRLDVSAARQIHDFSNW